MRPLDDGRGCSAMYVNFQRTGSGIGSFEVVEGDIDNPSRLAGSLYRDGG